MGVFEKINNLGKNIQIKHYVFSGEQGKHDSIIVVAQLYIPHQHYANDLAGCKVFSLALLHNAQSPLYCAASNRTKDRRG